MQDSLGQFGSDARAIRGLNRLQVCFSGPEAKDRRELEAFVFRSFSLTHGAHVRHFMPMLLSLRNTDGELLAVCGLRSASDESLFLEPYLDGPVQHVLQMRTGRAIEREDIVEVGNLACSRPGMARRLIAILASHLHETGMGWFVFTANRGLRNTFARLGIGIMPLCLAQRSRLPPECREGWGSYYDKNPFVMAGNVIQNHPFMLDRLALLGPLP